ncbi:phage adaptor protein [Streptomyces paludis]|uniref:Uncharacterized protein n=1 Tax=Streptomyces paludis TaxID=2282738 RepID=A0A345HWR8_9ACTN|nr:hypothetical protein [Streptomyces paludis]AXG81142.1 hypothetical protein DVK44_29520 [Streptomyces paludis]
MPTFDQLVARVKAELQGFALDQASVSELAAPMGPADTSFMCDGSTVANLSRGMVEIDDELILVKAFDSTSGVVSVMGLGNGRGYQNTTPAAHAVNALVTSSPAFPRARVKDELNNALKALYPSLVVLEAVDFPFNAAQVEYPLPEAATDVWYVTGRWVGPERVSAPMPNWRYNPKALPADFPTGKSIQLFDGVTPGQNVRVVYVRPPVALVAGDDDFTVSGYPERLADLIVWDACKRLLPSMLSARLQQQAVEATERAALVSSRDIATAVQLYGSLYAEGLAQERALQFTEVPNYQTFQGS